MYSNSPQFYARFHTRNPAANAAPFTTATINRPASNTRDNAGAALLTQANAILTSSRNSSGSLPGQLLHRSAAPGLRAR